MRYCVSSLHHQILLIEPVRLYAPAILLGITSTPITEERRYTMTQSVRLLDGRFSEGNEALTRLSRSSLFTTDLSDEIRKGKEDRAVDAMRRALLPEPLLTATGGEIQLPPNHYIVPCRYAKIPSMADLKKTFHGGVSDLYDGREWKKYSLCINASETPGNRIVLAHCFNRRTESEEAIAWGDDNRTEFAPNGYRPTMGHNEAIDFHLANPELYKQRTYVSLGSFARGGGDRRCVSVLDACGGRPVLYDRWFHDEWYPGRWFLFVRK